MTDAAVQEAGAGVPRLEIDPFGMDFLADPYAVHPILRDAGPVVWLERYGIFGMARHEQVADALRDWQTYSSARGVGLADFAKENFWRTPSLLLEADPPLHDRPRSVVGRVLSLKALRALRPAWEAEAERLIETLVARRRFDGVTDLAEIYPLSVFPDAIGLPREGREHLLPFATMAFNAFGPRNRLTEESMANAAQAIEWVAATCKRTSLAPGGFGAAVFAHADTGEITEEEAERLIRSFLIAGLDTTINGIGNALHAFARYPEQWNILRGEPALLPGAFEEVLRFDSTVQTFFRTTTRDVEIEGVTIPEGAKVLLFLAAANRDPRRWPDADRFDVRRRAIGHVGFGNGLHACVGQMIARQEAVLVLGALLRQVARIELDGVPVARLNNTLHALGSLKLVVHPAA